MIEKPSAVVVGRNLNALGVVRSLAAGGVPVVLLCASRFNFAALSRHCRIAVAQSLSGRELIRALKVLRSRFDAAPVLYLTEDDSVTTVSEMGAELEGLYHINVPSPAMTEILADKALFHEFAVREGLPVPYGRVIRRAGDEGTLSDFDLPIIVKPADKGLIANGADRRVRLARSREEAVDRIRWLVSHKAGALAQSWVGGADDAIYFCLFYAASDGTPRIAFTGRKLASFPPGVGMTAICAPAPQAHEELVAITTKLAQRLGMSGLGSVEFKWDPRANGFVIIEPTVGRTDWQEEIATVAGVNIPLAAYCDFYPDAVPPQPKRTPLVAWRWSLRHRPKPGSLPPGTRIWDGYWRLSDPAPGLAYYLFWVPSHAPQRLLSMIAPWLRRAAIDARHLFHPTNSDARHV